MSNLTHLQGRNTQAYLCQEHYAGSETGSGSEKKYSGSTTLEKNLGYNKNWKVNNKNWMVDNKNKIGGYTGF
jgi:hypothetical protein